MPYRAIPISVCTTHGGCFLTLRLFKSEQPSPVGFPTMARLESTSSIQRDALGVKRLANLGNYVPRQCGIATFTTHLADAPPTELPDVDPFVLAMNDAGRRHTTGSITRRLDWLDLHGTAP